MKPTRHQFSKEVRQRSGVNALGNTLIVGGGRTAWMYAFLIHKLGICSRLAVLVRQSCNGELVERELVGRDGAFDVEYSSASLLPDNFEGTAPLVAKGQNSLRFEGYVDELFVGYESLVERTHEYDSILLCTPNNDYTSALRQLVEHKMLHNNMTLVLVSSRPGATDGLLSSLNPTGCASIRCNMVTFGQYFAATRFNEDRRTSVITDSVKVQVPVWFSNPDHRHSRALVALMAAAGVSAVPFSKPLEAEIRTSNLFVHPPLTLTDIGLNRLFSGEKKSYLYRLFPEGLITSESFELMVGLEEETNAILSAMGLAPLNLLQLIDTMYPVPTALVSESDVREYGASSAARRQYLLAMSFWGRQVDPAAPISGESEDYAPHYRNFTLEKVAECPCSGTHIIPRNPREDYEMLLLLKLLAESFATPAGTISLLCRRFEEAVFDYEHSRQVRTNASLSKCRRDAETACQGVIENVAISVKARQLGEGGAAIGYSA